MNMKAVVLNKWTRLQCFDHRLHLLQLATYIHARFLKQFFFSYFNIYIAAKQNIPISVFFPNILQPYIEIFPENSQVFILSYYGNKSSLLMLIYYDIIWYLSFQL